MWTDMPHVPTLKDLARELGLSVPAVSLGLRRAGNISEATCKRIQEAAEKMGYRPNPHAAALSTGAHTGTRHGMPLAILRLPLDSNNSLYPISKFVGGITRRADELGYRVEIFTLGGPQDLARHLKMLYNRGFQGIFLPPIGQELQVRAHDWNPFSVVACGRYDQTSPFHAVRQETFESTSFLLNEVIRRGYGRICVGLLRHEPQIPDDSARSAAAMACCPPADGKVSVFFSSGDRGLADFVSWLKKEKPDAAVGFSVAHYEAMLKAGLKIPFAALHLEKEKNEEGISGLITLSNQLGIVAANRMDAMIRRHERGLPPVPELISIRSEWQEGNTLPFRT